MKKAWAGGLIFLIFILFSGCCLFETEEPDTYKRGELVSQSEEVILLEGSQIVDLMDDYLGEYLIGDFITIGSIPVLNLDELTSQMIYDVKAYKITFKTIGANDERTIQSGLVLLPVPVANNTSREPLVAPILSIQHGTIFSREESPSNLAESGQTDNLEVYNACIAASMGYVVFMPDFSGFGVDDQTLHPFCHAKSIAYSVVDIIRAGKQFLRSKTADYTWNNQLFIAGYSEGGFATMAAGKEIQTKHPDEFTITGLAPMSGPYNLSTVMKKIVTDDQEYTHLDFLSYMIFAYNDVYPLFDSPDELFKQPYATTIPPLFDGEHSSDEIRASLPNHGVGKASDIFTQKLFTDLANDQSEVSKALKDNDLYNTWVPNLDHFPMFMFHSSTDEAVPVENSRTAKDYYDAHNGSESVFYTELPTGKHVQSYLPAYALAYLWMGTLRE